MSTDSAKPSNKAAQAKAIAESANKAKELLAQLSKVQSSAKTAKAELDKESDESESEG